MRISDWSSDVCSSDLSGCSRRLIGGLVHLPPFSDANVDSGSCRTLLFASRRTGTGERQTGCRAFKQSSSLFRRHSVRQVPTASLQGSAGLGCRSSDPRTLFCPRTAHPAWRSEEHTSELQSLMRISYAVFCLKNKKTTQLMNANDR